MTAVVSAGLSPLAFIGVCAAEVRAFSEDSDRFASSGTVVPPIRARRSRVEAFTGRRRDDAALAARIEALGR